MYPFHHYVKSVIVCQCETVNQKAVRTNDINVVHMSQQNIQYTVVGRQSTPFIRLTKISSPPTSLFQA